MTRQSDYSNSPEYQSIKELLDKFIETFRTTEITEPKTNKKVSGFNFVFNENEYCLAPQISFISLKHPDGKFDLIDGRELGDIYAVFDDVKCDSYINYYFKNKMEAIEKTYNKVKEIYETMKVKYSYMVKVLEELQEKKQMMENKYDILKYLWGEAEEYINDIMRENYYEQLMIEEYKRRKEEEEEQRRKEKQRRKEEYEEEKRLRKEKEEKQRRKEEEEKRRIEAFYDDYYSD